MTILIVFFLSKKIIIKLVSKPWEIRELIQLKIIFFIQKNIDKNENVKYGKIGQKNT